MSAHLLLLLVLKISFVLGAIIPSSITTVNLEYNNKLSQQQIISFTCSETNPSGSLIAGNYLLNITCNPPINNYQQSEIARVPLAIDPYSNLFCLVPDENAFQASVQASIQAQVGGTGTGPLPQRRLLSVQKGPNRNILQSVTATKGVNGGKLLSNGASLLSSIAGIAGLTLSLYEETQIQDLYSKYNTLHDDVSQISAQLVQQAVFNQHTAEVAQLQQDEIGNVTLGLIDINSTLYNLQDGLNTTNTLLANVKAGSDAQFNLVQSFISANITSLNDAMKLANNQTTQNFINVYSALQAAVTLLNNSISSLQFNDQAQFNTFQTLVNQQEDLQSNRLLLQGITQQIFETVQAVSEDKFPFFADQGLAPTQLSGIDLRNLQELIHLNYVTSSVGSNYEVHNTQLRFYLNTTYGFSIQINSANFPMQMTNLIQQFSTSGNCTRSYISPSWSGALDTTPDSTSCGLWVEVSDYYCSSSYSPKFNWTGQSVSIPTTNCSPQPTVFTVLKTYDQFKSYVQTSLCPRRGSDNSTFFLTLTRAQTYLFLNPSKSCLDPWDTAVANIGTNGVSLLQALLYYVNSVWPLSNIDLLRKRAKAFGIIPQGVKIEFVPYFHLPSGQNGSGSVYDGAAKASCVKATWSAVSYDLLPVYQIAPANPPVYKSVTVSVQPINGYQCQNSDVCYPVGSSQVSSNIILDSDSPPPQAPSVFMGSVIPSVVINQGIYDTPMSELKCSPNTRSNANTVCYLQNPPGQTQTLTLPQWSEYIGANLYDADSNTVSASTYRVPAVFDNDGFPMCSNGQLPGAAKNVTTDLHNCILPFRWMNNSLPNLLTSTTAWNKPTECLETGSVVLFQYFQDSIQSSFLGTSALSLVQGSLVSFWFRSPVATAVGSEIIIIEVQGTVGGSSTYLRFLVDQNGIPAVILSTSATAETLTMDSRTVLSTFNLRDSLLHKIVWVASVSNYNQASDSVTYQLWIDNILQGSYTSSTYIQSTAAPVFSKSTLSAADIAADNSDVINLGLYNPTQTTNSDSSYSCEQSYFGQMCGQSNGEQLKISRMNVSNTGSVFCDPNSKLLLSTKGFDALYPQSLSLASSLFSSSVAFSLSFWIRLPVSPVYGNLVTIQNARTLVQISLNAGNQRLQLFLNSVLVPSTLTGLYLQDKNAHFVYLTFDGNNALVYLDGALVGSSTQVTPASASTGTSFSVSSTYISMLKYYNGEASSVYKVATELSCQIDSSLNTFSYLPPIGFCEQSLADPVHAYCRSSLLCLGRCSAYSVYDNYTHTFTPSSLICDKGYQLPDCTKPCSRIDSNGLCIDSSYIFSPSPAPLGFLCHLTEHYQVQQNLQTNQVLATARNFLYLVSMQVPLGSIISELGAASCPVISVTQPTGSYLMATFQNSAAVEANIRVFYTTTAQYLDPNDIECLESCCNTNTQGALLSIPPYASNSLQVPGCQNMTLWYSILTGVSPTNTYSLCSTLSGTSLQDAVTTGNNQQNAGLISIIEAETDTRNIQLFKIQQAYLAAILDQQLLLAAEQNGSAALLYQLQVFKQQVIQENVNNYLSFNFSSLNNPVDIAPGFQALLNRSQQDLQNAENNQKQLSQILDVLAVLEPFTQAAINNLTAEAAQNLRNAIALQIMIMNQPDYKGSNPISDFKNLLDSAVNAGKKGVDAITDGLGNLFGGLGGIGGIISTLITYVIYGVMAIAIGAALFYGGKFLIKCTNKPSSSAKRERKSKASDEEGDEEDKLVKQPKTSGRRTGYD